MMVVNWSNRLPLLDSMRWRGLSVYVRHVREKDVMRKFQGIGLSELVLKRLNPVKPLLVVYLGKKTHTYLTTPEKFLESEKVWINSRSDLQRFVSFADMEEIL